MFTQEDLDELLAFEPGDGEVISLYVNADPGENNTEAIKLQVRGLLKEAGHNHAADAERVEQYIELVHDWRKPGLALFSCAERDFFHAFQVAVPFRNRVRVGKKPYVKPLLHFTKYYGHYGVILVDKIGARFFEFHLGELQDTAGAMGEDVRKLKHGGGSTAAGMRGGQGTGRSEDETAHRNMREAAEAATHFFKRHQIRRLFLGGTAENVALFREMLPKQLQSTIAATFAMDMDATELEVKERSLQLLHEMNAEREQKIVEQMLSGAASGGNAVTGLGSTLRMVSDGRVDTLVISDGYRAPGYRHLGSGYLAASPDAELFGDENFAEIADVVNAAVDRTVEQGGHVEVISENPRLESAGRIGALLRY